MLGRIALLLAFAVLLHLAASSVARAQAPDDESRARDAFVLGSRAFDDRRWEDAARYFERAYQLSGRPALLFNVGATYERMGERAQAIDAFERYLRELPDADNRAEVEERLHTLRAGVSAPDEAPADGPGPLPWVVVAAGAGAAGAGAVFLVLANDAADRVEAAPTGTYWDMVAGDAANASTFSVVGAVLLAVGGAAVAGGLVWALVGGGSEGEGVAIGPRGVMVRGRF